MTTDGPQQVPGTGHLLWKSPDGPVSRPGSASVRDPTKKAKESSSEGISQ